MYPHVWCKQIPMKCHQFNNETIPSVTFGGNPRVGKCRPEHRESHGIMFTWVNGKFYNGDGSLKWVSPQGIPGESSCSRFQDIKTEDTTPPYGVFMLG